MGNMDTPKIKEEHQYKVGFCRYLGWLLIGVFATLCLACATLFIYKYYLISPRWDKAFGLSDERFYFAPQSFFLDVSLKNGEFPLWNPLSYCGMPFAADPQASACYPPHLIRSLLTPSYDPFVTMTSLHILRFLHLIWAGLGVICLARLYKLSLPAALVGAFAFMFNAYNIIYFTEFLVYPFVIVWAPWVLWAAKRAFDATKIPSRVLYGIVTVFLFTFSTLAGFPQLSLYLGLLLVFFGVFDFLMNHRYKCHVAGFLNMCRTGVGRGMLLAAIAVLTLLASCVLLLPAMELGSTSARVASSGVKISGVISQEFSPLHLLKCIIYFPGNTWWPQGPRAAGIGALLAALCAITHKNRRNVIVFSLLYLVMTDCTLGPPFPIGTLIRRFDILNIAVCPWRAGSFESLPFAMMAAFGVDAAGRAPAKYWARFARLICLAVSGSAMLYLLHLCLRENILHQNWLYIWHIPLVTLLVVCVFSVLSCPRLGRWVVGLLIAAEIIVWSAQMLPAYVSRRVAFKLDTNTFGEYRNISSSNIRTGDARPNWNMFTLDLSMAGYNPLYVGETRRTLCCIGYENLYRGYLKGEHVLVDNQRGNLLVKRSFWLARQWVSGNLPDKTHVFPAATTVFLNEVPDNISLPVPEVSRMSLQETAVSDDTERIDLGVPDGAGIVARGTTLELPLRSFVQNFAHSALYLTYRGTGVVEFTPVCRDEAGRAHLLRRSRTVHTRGEERILEIPLPDCGTSTVSLVYPRNVASQVQLTGAYVLKDLKDENKHIDIERYTANTVSVKLNGLSGPRILTFLDSWYPGWRAWVDGEEVPIMRANDAFKAVVVPAGSHQVDFKFLPRTTIIGFVISATTFLGLIAVLIGIMITRRPSSIQKLDISFEYRFGNSDA